MGRPVQRRISGDDKNAYNVKYDNDDGYTVAMRLVFTARICNVIHMSYTFTLIIDSLEHTM